MKKCIIQIIILFLIVGLISCMKNEEVDTETVSTHNPTSPTILTPLPSAVKIKYKKELDKLKKENIKKYFELSKEEKEVIDYGRFKEELEQAFIDFDYAELLDVSDVVSYRVSNGGYITENGNYVGGKWGVWEYGFSWSDPANAIIDFEYVSRLVDDGENMNLYIEIAKGGGFDKNGKYNGGKYGLADYVDCKYGYIDYGLMNKVIVAIGGERLENGEYRRGKWGLVDVETGKEIVVPKYDRLYFFPITAPAGMDAVYNDFYPFPYIIFENNGYLGIIDSITGMEVEKATYAKEDELELMKKYAEIYSRESKF